MQDEDLKLIRQIVASGGRKYTAGNVDRSRYDRLVEGLADDAQNERQRRRISRNRQGPSGSCGKTILIWENGRPSACVKIGLKAKGK
jgi:hypothetical protein